MVFRMVPAGNDPDFKEYNVIPIPFTTEVFDTKLNVVPPADSPRAPAAGLFQVTVVTPITEPVKVRSACAPLFVARSVKE